ncbi:MAG: aminotransferase class V-fold PLP-dependent enzyme [Trueperaceae bacterium]|nr:aminotransferase class V-fold PLP-dependent enzyme [Trueperaceae bacterium]
MTAVYADYAAAAPLRPEARAAVLDALDAGLGNPSSAHDAGRRARARVEAAREEVAAALGAHPLEIVFTSGATEANNLALAGVATARALPTRIAVPATEHASVLAPARALAARAHVLIALPVGATGRTAPAAGATARPDLVSVALVNAETGVVQDVAVFAAAARAHGAIVHVDAAQAPAFLPVTVAALGADLVTLSSAKLGGPAGAGALWIRRGTAVVPLVHGGPQEQGLRAGSENVVAVAGFATALALAIAEREREAARLDGLRTRLRAGIAAAWPGARFTLAPDVPAAPHVVSVALPGIVGEDAVAALDLEGIAASTGSACAAGAAEPSHVLVAMGRTAEDARAALRLSLGWASTTHDVDAILAALGRIRARVARPSEEAAWPAHGS